MGQCGGLGVIFEVLCNEQSGTNLEEKSEAAGLLAQITSPWLDPPEGADDAAGGVGGVGGGSSSSSNNLNSWPTLNLTPYVSPFIAALTGSSLSFIILQIIQIINDYFVMIYKTLICEV